MVRWTLWDTLAFLLLLSLFLPLSLIMFIPLTSRRPALSWKALNLQRTLSKVSSAQLRHLSSSPIPCVLRPDSKIVFAMLKRMHFRN